MVGVGGVKDRMAAVGGGDISGGFGKGYAGG